MIPQGFKCKQICLLAPAVIHCLLPLTLQFVFIQFL